MSRAQHLRQLVGWREDRAADLAKVRRRKRGGLPAAGQALRKATRQLLEAELRVRRRAGRAEAEPQPTLFGGT